MVLLGVTKGQAITSQVGAADDLGVGVAMGQPFGVTAKYWQSQTTAVDAFAGYHFNSNFDVHADYLWHSYSSFNVSNGRLPFYAGVGTRVMLGDSSQLGVRFPFGASYLFASNPLETFIELAPVVKLTGGLGADLDGVVGVRLYVNYLR